MIKLLLIYCLSILIFTCCNQDVRSNQARSISNLQVIDGKYDSNFPLSPVDDDIARIEQTVKLITNLSFYQAYDFPYASKVKYSDLTEDVINSKSNKRYIVKQPASGTATLIAQNLNKIALLTCEHIISAPDTLINYYTEKNGDRTLYIQNIAVKTRESINIITMSGLEHIQILASDLKLDIAIVEAVLNPMPILPVPVFTYKMGHAEELNWGTFVYIIGFPYGKKMISTGVVSSPNRDKQKSFIVDATMNRGISGGLILALRDGPPNFELVGIASALSAEREYILRPDEDFMESDIDFGRPYEGEIIIDKQMKINYGITYAISIDAIQNFIEKNRQIITEEGFSL